ncbi:hypothetical protein C0993_010074, partial [Termitomyces sp. T159_Od127]
HPEQVTGNGVARKEDVDLGSCVKNTMGTNPAIMPTSQAVDAAEPEASGNVGSLENDKDPSVSNSGPDDDDHHTITGQPPVVDKTKNSNWNKEPEIAAGTEPQNETIRDTVFTAARRSMMDKQ